MRRINLVIKRLFDVLASGVAIVLLLPAWIGIPIAIKLDSKGPVFFKQGRRTKNGRVFQMHKFRTMVINAEQMGTGLFSYENDPRVTKIGRKLRNSSIDELPQLFDIFVGDMSIVGPRPCVDYELGDFDTINEKFRKRFEVKGGLTGLAQVKGRNDISWNEKIIYDNQYVDLFNKYGCLIDLKILLLTILKVLKREDVYENKSDASMSDEEAAKIGGEEIIRLAHMSDCELEEKHEI